MFAKSFLFVLALVLSSTAGPVPEGYGGSIASQRHSSLAESNGRFNHARALRQVVRDHNKHTNNLMNLEKNLGREAFNDGAEIKPFIAHPLAEKRQTVSLSDESNDEYWAGEIAVGTPQQKFLIDFDTGSSDLWFPSTNCTADNCGSKKKYDSKASSSGAPTTEQFTIHYGDGSSVAGPVWTETVEIAGVQVTNQYLSPVTTLSDTFKDEADDGILGLAFPSLSSIRQSPFLNAAKEQGKIKSAEFGIKLTRSGSELFLGGTDSSLYKGDIEYYPVLGQTGYWQIGGGKLTIGSNTVASDMKTVIDSGTTLIYGPPDVVDQLYKNVPGASLHDSTSGFYAFPCDNVPSDVTMSWGGKTWTISAENMNVGRIDWTHCVGAIAAKDLGLGTNVWLVGDSFMKNVYSAFSFERNAVGFAELK